MLFFAFATIALLSTEASGATLTRRATRQSCQTFGGSPNLGNCPPGTVYVSATDHAAKFNTVQKAVNSGASTILVGKGTYNEQVRIIRSTSLTLLGQTSDATRSSTGSSGNLVRITWSQGVQSTDGTDIHNTAVLNIQICPDFKLYNIDLVQLKGPDAVALALAVDYSQASFYGSDIQGYQDTVYLGGGANVFMKRVTVRGSVDYLCGKGKLWVEASTLANRGQGYIAAWQGSPGQLNGAYISNSVIQRSSDVGASPGSVALGRPWNSAARIVYLSCSMDNTVSPSGFDIWYPSEPRLSTSLYLAESGSSGPGWVPSSRKFITSGPRSIDLNHLEYPLTPDQAKQWTVSNVFGNAGTACIDWDY